MIQSKIVHFGFRSPTFRGLGKLTNLAVRTHKLKTFEVLNHHEPNVALDVAQGLHTLKRNKTRHNNGEQQ